MLTTPAPDLFKTCLDLRRLASLQQHGGSKDHLSTPNLLFES